jgi:hypothetical protein
MSVRAKIVRDGEGRLYGIRVNCPGCESGAHVLPVSWLPESESIESPHSAGKPHWTFNGDFERPTFGPSVLSRGTYGEANEARVCHSFVRDGRIEFLSDCTHALAGQTVDLPEIADTDSEADCHDA